MVDLTTTYLGMTLKNPLVPSASPLSEELDTIKRMEDAGASAVVFYSLFEEQLEQEQRALHHHMTEGTESFAEALTYFPEPDTFHVGSEGYLKHIQEAKRVVDIPIIASLNGSSLGGWIDFARQIQDAGADALELNIYSIPTDVELSGAEVEKNTIDVVRAVKAAVALPVAVKLSPYFSNMAYTAKQLEEAGADGLVLFNRFYQPDIDLEALEVTPNLLLSTPQAMRLPLHWIGILHNRVDLSMAATSGIYTAQDVLKMLMVGADVTMMASALLRYGVNHLRTVEADLRQWLEENEYESVQQMQGSMSQEKGADATAFERVQYMRTVKSYHVRR